PNVSLATISARAAASAAHKAKVLPPAGIASLEAVFSINCIIDKSYSFIRFLLYNFFLHSLSPSIARTRKTVYWIEVKYNPCEAKIGIETISPIIQKIQFSTFFTAIKMVATKKKEVLNESIHGR